MCFLPLIWVFAYEPFSTLFERKKKRVLWLICANAKSTSKSILGRILIRVKGAKSHKYLLSPYPKILKP
jgi:hypothetical protein